MKTTSKPNRNGFRLGLCAFACVLSLALTACNSNDSNPVSSNGNATVIGRVESGVLARNTAGAQGVVVTAFAINVDGSRGQLMGKDTTDAQGNFQIMTDAQGGQNWLLVAAQGNMEWMTRYCDTLTSGDEDTARPINFESTLQTQVYLNLQKSDSGRRVGSGEITAAIDFNVASSNRLQYESGDSGTRIGLVSHLSAEIMAQFQAQSTYMSNANSQYSSDTAGASVRIRKAEGNLTVALYNANGDASQTQSAEKAYLQAMISAHASSDSGALSCARAHEAAYHATLMATAQVSDSTRNSMCRRSLYIMAMASDTAMVREFHAAGASQSQLQGVAVAGATFENAINISSSDASRDSAMSQYRASIRSVFQSQGSISDSSFIAFLNLSLSGTLAGSLHTSCSLLQAALVVDMTSDNASGMGRDMQFYNAQATGAIAAQWEADSHNTHNAVQSSAMAQIMAFLSVSSNSSHNGA